MYVHLKINYWFVDIDFIHLMQLLWKEFTVSKFFKESGKLFQIIGPE